MRELSARGYITTIEHARHYIDTQRVAGRSVDEIKKNQVEFQKRVLQMQIAQEKTLSRGEVIFFDRAVPDALAYYRFLNLPEDDQIKTALQNTSYKKAFMLAPLPLVKDYARTEDAAAQQKIHELLVEVYTSLGIPIVHVPVLPLKERVDFILKNLYSNPIAGSTDGVLR